MQKVYLKLDVIDNNIIHWIEFDRVRGGIESYEPIEGYEPKIMKERS